MASPLDKKTKAQLYQIAMRKNIPNRSKMDKEQLLHALIAASTHHYSKPTSPAANMYDMIVLIKKCLYDSETDRRIEIPESMMRDVLAIYRKNARGAAHEAVVGARVIDIALLGKSVALLVQVPKNTAKEDLDVLKSMLEDIDDDGNHPFKLGHVEYLLSPVSSKIFYL